ncbi:hypothetical protein Q7C36_021754 [Tachysurus vachellii]|uniref:Uncharacterized protein n=1 Tax=Tachysurus vachellii TaxID=175792 RepID=A0AA88LPD2_TACVA|nr:hypothetical protein Q7C36_021754 [Tachysurus vachellii]
MSYWKSARLCNDGLAGKCPRYLGPSHPMARILTCQHLTRLEILAKRQSKVRMSSAKQRARAMFSTEQGTTASCSDKQGAREMSSAKQKRPTTAWKTNLSASDSSQWIFRYSRQPLFSAT